jgi:hypothetical protein
MVTNVNVTLQYLSTIRGREFDACHENERCHEISAIQCRSIYSTVEEDEISSSQNFKKIGTSNTGKSTQDNE